CDAPDQQQRSSSGLAADSATETAAIERDSASRAASKNGKRVARSGPSERQEEHMRITAAPDRLKVPTPQQLSVLEMMAGLGLGRPWRRQTACPNCTRSLWRDCLRASSS